MWRLMIWPDLSTEDSGLENLGTTDWKQMDAGACYLIVS